MKKSILSSIVIVSLLIVLIFPIAIYTANFGFHVSDNHERWGQAGDFLGAAYGSITAIFTIFILIIQMGMQANFSDHEKDQAFFSNARSDLNYYIEQLSIVLDKRVGPSEIPISKVIVEGFGSRRFEYLKPEMARLGINSVYDYDDRVVALWSAINICFDPARKQDSVAYKHFYDSSIGKCIAMFGYELCEALDNLHFVAFRGSAQFRYAFSSLRSAD